MKAQACSPCSGPVYIKDRRIRRAEFSEVFAPLFSRPSSNKALKVELLTDAGPYILAFAGFPFGTGSRFGPTIRRSG